MAMRRYFFISSDLGELERFEQDLKQAGIVTPQIHVLTDFEDQAQEHHLHQVTSFMKTDIVHSTLVGAVGGVCLAVLLLFITAQMGWHEIAGPIPFIFLAIVVLGFCTWEGGLWGIQVTNTRLRQFKQVMRDGQHVFFVDLARTRGKTVLETASRYPAIRAAGLGHGAPKWLVFSQHGLKRFFTRTFP